MLSDQYYLCHGLPRRTSLDPTPTEINTILLGTHASSDMKPFGFDVSTAHLRALDHDPFFTILAGLLVNPGTPKCLTRTPFH